MFFQVPNPFFSWHFRVVAAAGRSKKISAVVYDKENWMKEKRNVGCVGIFVDLLVCSVLSWNVGTADEICCMGVNEM